MLAALLATLFTWLLTALGASVVLFIKNLNQKLLDGMLGFTGGVMVAASFWSLLNPAIAMSDGEGFIKVIPAAIGTFFFISPLTTGIVPQSHIGNNKPVKLMYFIETLENALGKKALKEFCPMQPGDVYQTYADVSELTRDFGFKPSTSLQEGLAEFVKWFRVYYHYDA